VTNVKRRSYRSGIRRGDAPRLICEAAHRLFVTKGYAATSIEDIAAEAGVARPTIFTAVGPKPAILKAVVDQAVGGDEEDVPVAERPWFVEALEEKDPARALRLHVRNMSRIQQRFAQVLHALETAAAVDADAAELYAEMRRQRRIGIGDIAADIAGKAKLRCDWQTLADVLLAVPHDSFRRLVHEEGWPVEKWEAWLLDLIERVCLDGPLAGGR
jgi:AcrR family transcriptional regulator